MSELKRKLAWVPFTEAEQALDEVLYEEGAEDPSGYGRRAVVMEGERAERLANLVSSELEGDEGLHAPVLDLDFPCELVPSSTEGHFHLYLNRELDWSRYVHLLLALKECGLLEEGYVEASLAQGRTYVRRPEVRKQVQRA